MSKTASASSPATPTGKLVSLVDLVTVGDALRAAGRRITLCHGVFDLMHVGHLRHLKSAREFGDVLVVSITADQWVNKGPGRPAFAAELRAEMLSGLDAIDYVAIVDEPSAHSVIEALKPDFYVKGSEYADASKDITGKIAVEQDLVESFGGRLVFTDDIVFSSSRLLNQYFAFEEGPVRQYLDHCRGGEFEAKIFDVLDRVKDLRVLLVGETIIDHYVYVDALGKAAKENIIATQHRGEELFAGGVVAAANHLAAICPNLSVVTMVGDAEHGNNYENLIREQLVPTVDLSVVYRPGGPTVRKTRFVEPTYVRKLFEVYHMEDAPLPSERQNSFHDTLRAKIAEADVVVVCDFGHGLLTNDTVKILETEASFLAVNAQSNAGNTGYNLISKYSKPDFVCLDMMEARLAVGEKHLALTEIVRSRLPDLVHCPNIIVTHGKAGCFVSNRGKEPIHIPSFGGAAVDTVGAGDAFYVIAAPCVAAGADCEMAGFLGNVAGAIKIGIVGHRRYLTRLELQRYVKTLLK
jgi:rfaE bifunctional protein nucleotidyltransferase chain/domain